MKFYEITHAHTLTDTHTHHMLYNIIYNYIGSAKDEARKEIVKLKMLMVFQFDVLHFLIFSMPPQ